LVLNIQDIFLSYIGSSLWLLLDCRILVLIDPVELAGFFRIEFSMNSTKIFDLSRLESSFGIWALLCVLVIINQLHYLGVCADIPYTMASQIF